MQILLPLYLSSLLRALTLCLSRVRSIVPKSMEFSDTVLMELPAGLCGGSSSMSDHTLGCGSSSRLCGNALRVGKSRRCVFRDNLIEPSQGAPHSSKEGLKPLCLSMYAIWMGQR